jgi:hypothetical protein
MGKLAGGTRQEGETAALENRFVAGVKIEEFTGDGGPLFARSG